MEGVTPGRWMMEIEADDRVAESGEDRQPEVYVCSDRTACDYTVVATMGRAESIPHMRKSFDADWIARCSPAGISKLLDEIERLREAVKPFSHADYHYYRVSRDGWVANLDAETRRATRALRASPVLENQKRERADATPKNPLSEGRERS